MTVILFLNNLKIERKKIWQKLAFNSKCLTQQSTVDEVGAALSCGCSLFGLRPIALQT